MRSNNPEDSKMKNTLQFAKRLLPFSAFLMAPAALADTHQNQSYQTEINASYEDADYENNWLNAYHVPLQATYYFSPVDVTNVPLAEAAFLNQASSVSLTYQYSDYDMSAEYSKSKYRGLDINYYVPDTMFYVGAGIQQAKSENYYSNNYGSHKYETDWETRWVGRLGVAPAEGLLIWSEFYEHVKVSDYWNLNAKYVKPLSNGRAFGIESSYHNIESEEHSLQVIADYYFNNRFSLGVGISHYETDYYDDKDTLLRSRYFFTDNFSLDLTYTDQNYFDTWKIGATARF